MKAQRIPWGKGLTFSKRAKNSHLSQCTTKPTIRLMLPVKTQISLHIHTVWSESLLIACVFYSLRAIQRGIKENPCHTGWMYRLTLFFAGYKGRIVGFVMHLLICKISYFPLLHWWDLGHFFCLNFQDIYIASDKALLSNEFFWHLFYFSTKIFVADNH